jgi:hypothetical protein
VDELALLNSLMNIVKSVSPYNGATEIPITSSVCVNFSLDMNEKTITPSTIILLDDASNKVSGTVTYVDKTATFFPDLPLEPKTRYQLVVKGGVSGIKSLTEVIIQTDFNSNFVTAEVIPPSKVDLLSPVDQSVVSGHPTYLWVPVQSVELYDFQISREAKFGTILFSSVVSGVSITPDYEFEHNTLYYWRVRAIINGATPIVGAWSECNQFRYMISEDTGGTIGTTPATPISGDLDTFDIVSVSPEPDQLFVADPTYISAKFNDYVDSFSVTSDTFKVYIEDLAQMKEPTRVNGDIQVVGDTIIFTVAESPLDSTPVASSSPNPLFENSIYRVVIKSSVRSLNGVKVGDDIEWYFCTTFTPYYSTVSIVRNEVGTYIENKTDMEITRKILEVSQWADQIAANPYGTLNEDYLGDTQATTYNNIFYHEYVKYETALRLLSQTVLDRSKASGTSRTLGDLTITQSAGKSSDISTTLNRLTAARNQAKLYLTLSTDISAPTFALPRSVVKGETTYPYPLTSRNSF